MQSVKINQMNVIIIQARMDSTRLSGKILKNLAGHPQLWHVVKRASAAARVDKVIVATTINEDDNVVEQFCKDNNFLYTRGSLEDVLSRYYEAALKHGADVVVRVTADCPLIDPTIIDRCIDEFEQAGCDYISNAVPPPRTFPRGLDCEIVSFAALENAYKNAREQLEREHVLPYIWQNKKNEFVIGSTILASPEYKRDYRLTVDYPEDFELMETIYHEFYQEGELINVPDVLRWLDFHPEIVAINEGCEEKHRARLQQQFGAEQKP